MPNPPKFFRSAVNNGILSHTNALQLQHDLLTALGVLLDGYSGYFAPEIKSGPIGQSIRYEAEPDARSILSAHQNLGPDELYAAMPWPLMPALHFSLGSFSPAGIQGSYIEGAGQDTLRAMSIAIDVVTWGAGLNLDIDSITSRLDWMRSGRRSRLVTKDKGDFRLRKVLVPSFTGGFQGIAFGLFQGLPSELEQFVVSQLQQFSATIGDHLARFRQRDATLAFSRASTVQEYAQAAKTMLPPVEYAVFVAGEDRAGFALNREANFLAGYRSLRGEELATALADPATNLLPLAGIGSQPQIYIKLPADAEALSPLLTTLRLEPLISELPPLSSGQDVQPLHRSELGSLYHGLQRQIRDGRGAFAPSKKLFLVEAALNNFDTGEALLSNNKARQYTEHVLGKPNPGYHVAGKAAKKFEEDIGKMVPQRFVFEAVSSHSVRVRWLPAPDQQPRGAVGLGSLTAR